MPVNQNTFMHILSAIDSATSESEYLKVIEEIDNLEVSESQWLKYYYVSLCHILLSMLPLSPNQKDFYLNEAEKKIRLLELQRKNNDEILTLKAFWLQAKIMVSVLTRGPMYIKEAENYLKEAQAINPKNPRVYFLLGQAMLNKPSFIGGGKKNAQPYLTKAKALFGRFQPQQIGYPDWGEKQTDELLQNL